MKILKGLKLAYGFSEETLAFLAKFLAEEEGKKALAAAPKNVLKEEKTLSNFFDKKGKASSPKEYVNKYADKSKAETKLAEREKKFSQKNLHALENIRLRSSLEEHENAGGHMLKEHGARNNEGLAERFN
ncbi:hypothetical protein FAI41_05815 [Acetobacteraceae bacterium]|nr:hypothetical protein FAI41_05815 [Acetobacteraceae bacterium]